MAPTLSNLPPELIHMILDYLPLEKDKSMPSWSPEVIKQQRMRLITLSKRWPSIIEPFTFRHISKTCETPDDFATVCSMLGKEGRINHVENLFLGFLDTDTAECYETTRAIMTLLGSAHQDQRIQLGLAFRGADIRNLIPTTEEAKAKLQYSLPKTRVVESLVFGTSDITGSCLLATRLAESTPCASHKLFKLSLAPEDLHDISTLMKGWHAESTEHLLLQLDRVDEYNFDRDDRKSELRYERSSSALTRNMHQISLGLRELDLRANVGIGIEIFGPDILTGNSPAAKWPLLEGFRFDYDQCIIDAMDSPDLGVLSRMAWSSSEARRVWPLQERIWQAAAMAARQMPKLEYMLLTSRVTNGPKLEVLVEDDVDVTWSWTGFWRDTYAEWRISDKTCDVWRDYAKKHERSLEAKISFAMGTGYVNI